MKKYLAMLLCLAMLVTSVLSPFDFSVINAEAADTATIKADKVASAPDMNSAISADTWGEPTLSIDKDSYNTGLTKMDSEPEDVQADLYFRWDADNLYIGIKSPDADLTGYKDDWRGDGVQFKIQAGDAITAEAVDICLTWGLDGFDPMAILECFEVRGSGDNIAALRENIQRNIVYEDGCMSIMLAIPHKDMGYSADEVEAGAAYAMNLLRISARDGAEASDARAYCGWLEWGAYWDPTSTLHNENCVETNVIVLDEKIVYEKNVVEASKTFGTPLLDRPISADTWGEPTLSIDKDSYNTGLTRMNDDPEEVQADLYFRWDTDNLYIGLKSLDADLSGYKWDWQGDGVQFKLQAGDAITAEAVDICLTWGSKGFDPTAGGECFEVRGAGDNVAVLRESIKRNIVYEDGTMSVMLAIPHADMGYSADEVEAGAKYAMNLLRISGRDGEGASEARSYCGWLEWGAYWDPTSTLHNENCVETNVIFLFDKDSGSQGGDVQESSLLDVTAAVAGVVSKDGLNDTMKVVDTPQATYVSYMLRSSVFTGTDNYKALNEFRLYEISGEKVNNLGIFYTRSGDVDVLADGNGIVYVVGGSSNRVLKELDTKHYDTNSEKAVLQIFEYDSANGLVINECTTQKDFANAKGYRYLTAALSPDGNSIYSFYIADTTLSWFTYDIAAHKWVGGEQSTELAGAPDKSFVFSGDGTTFVYAVGSSVYALDLEGADSVQLCDGVGELKDVYADNTGKLHVLYSAEDKVFLSSDGELTEIAAMEAADYGRIIEDENGALHILAMAQGEAATVDVLSADSYQIENTLVLDSKVVPKTAPIIAAPRNGSVLDGNVSILFPANFRTSTHWYYVSVALN